VRCLSVLGVEVWVVDGVSLREGGEKGTRREVEEEEDEDGEGERDEEDGRGEGRWILGERA